jgi:plastin-2
LLNSEMKTLFVETLKRLHGEVCLDEIYSLFSSIQFNNGTIDTKLLKSVDHQLPQGHLNIGQITINKENIAVPASNLKKAPSCELLDQLDADDMDKGILLYNLDEYGKRIFEKLSKLTDSGLEINEEDKVTIAEAFSEIDEDQTGGVSESKLDNLFKSCRRELPGYELRKIIDSRENHNEPISLNEFAQFYIDQRSHDYSNKFKASIKEAKDVVNKKNNEIEVEKANTMSYNASHSYSLAERRAFSSWINQHLSTDPDCKEHIPIDVDTEKLFNSLEDGIVLCKAINCAKPNTIDERVLNKKNLNIFKKRENLILGLNSALSLGCKIVNIRPEDLSAGVPHLILGLLWQIIRHALLKNISLSKNVDIMALLKPGESIADLENMTPENILMRWVNHHLSRGEKGGALIWDGNHNALSSNTSGDFVSNFGNDLSNSVAYINLINQIGGKDLNKLGAKAIKIKDNLERAGAMLKMAEKIGVKPIITANDVIHGDEKLNMAFLATLFNSVSQTVTSILYLRVLI